MSIGDLVRNEVFSRVADHDPKELDKIDQETWQPFYNKFRQRGRNHFESYFFPFGLIKDPNVRKSDVFSTLREQWKDTDDPTRIIKSLKSYQNAYLDIACGANFQKHDKVPAAAFRRLYLSGAPSSTYPFLMQLSNALRDGKLKSKAVCQVLEVIESFLIRRAICGHEPTGLHSVFKRLWIDCDKSPNSGKVVQAIKRHKTVVWPSDAELDKAIKTRPLYGAAVTDYVLAEYDRSLKGDVPDEIPWIEHVLPDTFSKEWAKSFSKEEHERTRHLLANLIPLSKRMNPALGNKGYKFKRPHYEKKSMYTSARAFAKKHTDWTPARLMARSKELTDWAIKRWPL